MDAGTRYPPISYGRSLRSDRGHTATSDTAGKMSTSNTMRKADIRLTMAMLMALAAPLPAHAQTVNEVNATLDTLFGDHVAYKKFFDALTQAMAANDKQAIAAMVDYPFQARINGKAVKIRDSAHFVADYDKIVTEKVKQAVAKQTYASLFANWQGISIGDGELWFSGVGDNNKIKITAIND